MRCRKPRTVGFQPDGKTISWSQQTYSKEYPTFQLPCGDCLFCRFRYSKDWAVRAIHEASLWPENAFITLTYEDRHLDPAGLNYAHFQTFMKDLRNELYYRGDDREIGFMVAGEYGSVTKRPHWHACIFNWSPPDAEYSGLTELGDKVYSSQLLGPRNADQVDDGVNRLWNYGKCEFGSVTYQSAGYIARYATKEWAHGFENDLFKPIFKTSRKYAIGKRWLEKYYNDVFNYGYCVVSRPDGSSFKTGIPRYYEKWLQKNHFDQYLRYLEDVKYPLISHLENNSEPEYDENRSGVRPVPMTRSEVKHEILMQKFKNSLQKNLKL